MCIHNIHTHVVVQAILKCWNGSFDMEQRLRKMILEALPYMTQLNMDKKRYDIHNLKSWHSLTYSAVVVSCWRSELNVSHLPIELLFPY